jgi:hypothetical protein
MTMDNARVGLARTVWRYALRKKADLHRWQVKRHRAVSHAVILDTPPATVDPQSKIEIHSLTCETDYPDLLWCLKTFHFFSGRSFNVVIHDDGSLSHQAIEHLHKHLPGATIISKQQADARMREVIKPYDSCRAFRDRLPLARRLFDVPAFATRENFMILDSDILFFASPNDMLERMDHNRLFFMSDYQDGYVYPRADILARYGVEVMPAFNTGISYLSRDMFNYEFMEKYCGDLEQAGLQSHPWAEQTLFAILLSRRQGEADRLPDNYAISRKRISRETVSHHFVNDGSRGMFYTQGIRRLRKMGFVARYTKSIESRA